MSFVAPDFRKLAFTCPHCDAYSSFHWLEGLREQRVSGARSTYHGNSIWTATCLHCKQVTIWWDLTDKRPMVWPAGVSNAPLPHEDMPDDVRTDYEEARSIAAQSPRGAAALLRLAIQKLCKHLGEDGENINADIASLVKKGLPVQIQRALDVVRVTGNNAVHPGELRIEDKPEVVAALFGLVNLIVDNRIAEPRRIDDLYKSLPEGARKGIDTRDG